MSGDVLSRRAAEPAAAPVDNVDEYPDAAAFDDDTVSILSDLSEDFDDIYALPQDGGANNNFQNVRNR